MCVHACEGCLSEYSCLKVDVYAISCCMFMDMDVHEGKFVVNFLFPGKLLGRMESVKLLQEAIVPCIFLFTLQCEGVIHVPVVK